MVDRPDDPQPPDSSRPAVRSIVAGALDEDHRYWTRRRRGTSDWLLIHTTAGAGRVLGTDGTAQRVRPGQAVLLRPRTPHDYRTAPGADRWSLRYAHFHPRPEWRALLAWPEPVPGVGRLGLGPQVGARVETALTTAARASLSGIHRPELFAMNALEQALLWYDTQNPAARALDERVLAVLEHVEQHLAEPLDAGRLARVAHLSASRLTHLFTEQVGCSPLRYLEQQRLARAGQLLRLTTRPVAEIARAVGFADPLYFSTRFRRGHGHSPTAHRQGPR